MKIESIPFEIAYCSSFDSNYEPEQLLDLNFEQNFLHNDNISKNHRGWQTKKYPEYPQDLILQLKQGLCRISKVEILSHHYKIASQIELYVGITKEKEQESLFIQFTRLGFVNLDNNNRFQDRELKSIKINADCEYIRLVVKGCHKNRLNIHKQVGFLALNVLGYPVLVEEDSQHLIHEAALASSRSSSSYHSNDIDFNLENWIHVIQNAEEEAAQDENYKEAKIYKELGDRLTGLWKFLVNLDNEKAQAVAIKDYDEADKIKADMNQVRETAENLLKQLGIQINKEGEILSYDVEDELNEQVVPDLDDIETNQPKGFSQPSDQLFEEAIANWTSFDALSVDPNSQIASSPTLLSTLPIQKDEPEEMEEEELIEDEEEEEEEEEVIEEDPETIPEPLTSEDREYCELPISLFGENMISCIMSVKVKCRQNGLNQLSQLIEVESFKEATDMKFIQSVIIMLQEAVMDSREPIFQQTIQSWQDLQDIFPNLRKKDDKKLYSWIEKFFTRLLSRTNDSQSGIKFTASQMVLDLIESYPDLLLLCLKERMIRNLKDAKARIELVTLITKEFLLNQWKKDTSLYRQPFMAFIVIYLKKHPHSDVQTLTWELLLLAIKAQSKDSDFKVVASFLDNDTVKKLQLELKKSDKKLKSSTSSTVQELRALAVKSNKSVVTSKKPAATTKQTKSTTQRSTAAKKSTKTQQTKETEKKKKPEPSEEEKTNVCIFCDEMDQGFNEDTLISHYYNYCPVLTNCPMCQIILEVSTLKEHLEIDCEKKHLVKQCTNCKISVPVEQWLQHTLKKTCLATAEDQQRCPFCQLDMTNSTEANWKVHLIQKCTKNPRQKL